MTKCSKTSHRRRGRGRGRGRTQRRRRTQRGGATEPLVPDWWESL